MLLHTGEKPFMCQQCGRGFANAQALKSHHLLHTGERPFACQYCEKRFTGMTNLKKHVITHTGERRFQCHQCGKNFGVKWTLDLHIRTHSTERPHACVQCPRGFLTSKDLNRHLVIHSGEKPFKCWICETFFRRKDNLDRHIKNTHNQPREVAKQLANEAAAEYMAKKNEAKAAAASAQRKPSILGAKLNKCPNTSKAGVKLISLADYVPLASEEGVVITADISPTPSQDLKAKFQGQSEYHQSDEDPLYLHQPVAENSEQNGGTSQTFSLVLSGDGKFIREASETSIQEMTPQIVSFYSIASSESESVATLTDDDGPHGLSNAKNASPCSSGPALFRTPPSSAEGRSSASPIGGDSSWRSQASSSPETTTTRKTPSPDSKTLHPGTRRAHRREAEEREAREVNSRPTPTFGSSQVKIVSKPTLVVGNMNAGVDLMTDSRSGMEQEYHASQVVSMSSVKLHPKPASVVGQDNKLVQTCEKGIQCSLSQDNIDNGASEPRSRSYQIPAQKLILTNGNGQPVHQILSPKPTTYYHYPPGSNDRHVVYVIQHPHSAPSPQQTVLYTNSNSVATEVIRESHVRYATTSQAPARIVDAASGKTITYYTSLSPEAGPSSSTAQYQAQPPAEAPSAANEGRSSGLKLLYAEAAGVGTPDDNGHVQLMYTAAHPSQWLAPSQNQNSVYAPAVLQASGDNSELLFAHQRPRIQQQGGPPLPVEMVYRGNTVMAQPVNFIPHEMNVLRRNLNGTVSRVETVSRSSNPAATVVLSSQREIRNHHNYATSNEMPAVLATERYTRSPQCALLKEDGGNGEQVQFARGIATVRQIQDSDYQGPVQNGQESRHNGESIPHRGRGPDKQYIASQQSK